MFYAFEGEGDAEVLDGNVNARYNGYCGDSEGGDYYPGDDEEGGHRLVTFISGSSVNCVPGNASTVQSLFGPGLFFQIS